MLRGKKWVLFWLVVLLILSVTVAASATKKKKAPYDRVIIFGADGCGAMVEEADTPNFDRIFGGGKITYRCKSTLTISAPSWGAMFYGVSGDAHGTSNEEAGGRHKINELYTSIFKLTLDAYPGEKVGSFVNWAAINWGLIEWNCGVDIYPDKPNSPTADEVVSHVISYIETESPKLLFVYFVEPDDALHSRGYGSKKHREALHETDERIGKVYDALEERGLLENALVMFTTDHGGNGGSHGGHSEEEENCTFAVAGPGLEKEGGIGDMEVQDVAAVALYALGIRQPENMTARVPAGIFPGVGGEERKESSFPDLVEYYGRYDDVPEPAEALPGGLEDKLAYYQTFDGKVKGMSGRKKLTGGLFGKALNLNDSYLKTGLRSSSKWPGMTIGFWFRDDSEKIPESYGTDPVFVTDKNWIKGNNKGFAIAKLNEETKTLYRFSDKIQINIGDGSKDFRKDILWSLPENYRGKWIHCLVVFDPGTGDVTLYCDFAQAAKAHLLPERTKDWITGKGIIAGQDISGKYRCWTDGEMDDLMIFSDALTEDEVRELGDWYDRAFSASDAWDVEDEE